MLKVAAYARVSTDKEDQINSLTNQREYFESYIKSKDDWEFVEVYLMRVSQALKPRNEKVLTV